MTRLTLERIAELEADDRVDGICPDGEGVCYSALACAHSGYCQRSNREPSKVRYQCVALGGLRTPEQQAILLARAAYRVWEEWSRKEGDGLPAGVLGQDERLDQVMRNLYQQIIETDVYYSREV